MDPELKMNTERERELTGIGHGDFADFIGVKPNLAFPALEDAGGEPLLKLERHHCCCCCCFLSLPLLSLGASGGGFFAYEKSKGILYSTHDKAIFFRVRVLAESLSPERIIWRVTC